MKNIAILLISLFVSLLPVTGSFASQPLPASHPKIELPAQSTTHQQSTTISGKVLQSMNGGGYSYIYLQKNDGEKLWLAVSATKITVGDQMSFKEGLVMTNFESKTLKKTFDKIIFSNGIIQQTQAAPIAPAKTAPTATVPASGMAVDQKNPQGPMLGSKGAVIAKEKISVAKAAGANAVTVAEAYRKSARLDKKKIIVRGKVVKVTTGIMKRTWIHIQDGTGSQAKGTHNLVCTTKGSANVGDIITVNGTLAKDRDFGAGYKYKVIIEDAVLGK